MKTKYIGLLLIGMLGLSSCNKYLDLSPTDEVSDKLVWSNPSYAQMTINYFYKDIATLGSFNLWQCGAGMTEGLTDEFKYGSMTYNALMYVPNEISYGGSVLTASYVDVYLGLWGTLMEEIRRVNEDLYDLDNKSNFDEDTKTYMEAQLRFFRGLYYFELIKRYKQVILYDEDLSKISTNHALNTEAEGWDFVAADLNFAGENLKVSKNANGYVTSGAAYALLSRAMLYAERWSDAETAAKAVEDQHLYTLTSDYASAFTDNNSEAILQYTYSLSDDITHDFDNYYAPAGDKTLDGNTVTGGYGTPTQDMVEEYELATGGKPDWSTWHTEEGTTETPPYDKLEPRFAATILYNGASWKGRTIEPYVDGVDGWAKWLSVPNPEGKTTTGYYLRKLVDETHSFKTTQSSTQPWIAIRLAEVYLNYAEAACMLKDYSTAQTYLYKVRARVGLPKINKTGDDLMAAIRHERKVELAYEGLYYWDMRRWGLSTTAFTGTRRHGLEIVKNSDGTFTYTYVEVDRQNMNFPEKMLGNFPIPQDELNTNKMITQFANWN